MARANVTIYTALGANIALAVTKFVVARLSHSAAMGAEARAAVLGVVVVFILLFIGEQTGNRYLDGVASIVVGLILTLASALLARECRSLLIGEGISAKTQEEITGIVEKDPGVVAVRRLFSLYQSPDEVLLILVLAFRADLTAEEMNGKITALRAAIKKRYPRISYVVVEPE